MISPGVGLVQEHQDGEEEPVVMVAPLSNQRAFSTLPSVDSAVESWDGSNMDSSFTTPGRKQTSDLILNLLICDVLMTPMIQWGYYIITLHLCFV